VNGIEFLNGQFEPFTMKPVGPIVSQNEKQKPPQQKSYVYYGTPS
jgi:hypothetical protein